MTRASNRLLGAWCKPYIGVTDPLIAEAMALRDGVLFAKLRGYTHAMMEVDCLEMVESLGYSLEFSFYCGLYFS